LETKTISFGDLFGNGKIYKVPLFQRDYSWKEDHWEELWIDIKNIHETNDVHYMGAIVLQYSTGEKSIFIIDGQQRIATLSIIIMAALKVLTELVEKGMDLEENKERKEMFMRRFLGDKDPVSLRYSSKLCLNENNDNFYQAHLLHPKDPINLSRLNESDKLLWNSYNYFYKKIKDDASISSNGKHIALFIDKIIAGNLIFIQITVEDELGAYTVFETLNARGLQLTSTDLLKNYLFSLVKSKTDLSHVKNQWQEIINIIGSKDFPQFLRHYLNSKQSIIRKERLFKEIRSQIKRREEVFPLLDDLEKSADIYQAFDDADHDIWQENPEQRDMIKQLRLFNVVQPKSLLLSCYFNLNIEEFTKVLRIIVMITFRYNIIGGLNPNQLEDVYNKAAIRVFKNEISTARQVFQELKSVYVSDEIFKNTFSTKSMTKNKRLIKYILFSIENQISGENYDFDSSKATIEHILPENPDKEWLKYFDDDATRENVYRLGNLSLLETRLNKAISNCVFNKKRDTYSTSSYKIAKELAEYEEWTKQDIKERQHDLAKYATAIWRIDY